MHLCDDFMGAKLEDINNIMKKSINSILLLISIILSACSSENARNVVVTEDMASNRLPIMSPDTITPLLQQQTSGVVSIYVKDYPDYSDQSVCTGTLITPRYVLTAAHCVATLTGKFALLSNDNTDEDCEWTAGFVSSGASKMFNYFKVGFGRNSYEVQRNLYDIKSVTYHSGYSHVADSQVCINNAFEGYEFTENDIAILELAQDIPESVAKPIPLLPPWLRITSSQIDEGVKVTFAGFGYESFGFKGGFFVSRQYLTQYCDPASNERYCKYGKPLHIKGCHPSPTICANDGELDYIDERIAFPKGSFFYLQSKGGPCNGDSGGPALLYLGKQFYLAAITSYGDPVCRNYGVSLAVQDYYDWIVKNVPDVVKEYHEICNNWIDDDNNGLTDMDDPVCENEPYCGDGIVNGDEHCDGSSFHSDLNDCESWSYKYEAGKVYCNENCTINYDHCTERKALASCGNGILDPGEQCDGDKFTTLFGEPMDSNSCYDFSVMFSEGELSCSSNCSIETEACITSLSEYSDLCGNDVVDEGEYCDGFKFAKDALTKCADYDLYYSDGDMMCNHCNPDFSKCIAENICGDGMVTGEELCDGDNFMLDAFDCSEWSIRFESGKVKCNRNCSIDYSDCVLKKEMADLCGNNHLEDQMESNGVKFNSEECDGDLFLHDLDCSVWDARYSAGKVSCTDQCMINMKYCILDQHNVYDEEYGMYSVLNHETKPDIVASAKSEDSVKFYQGNNNQKEELRFTSASDPLPPPPIDEPPVVPEDPNPSEPVENLESSGCGFSAHPSSSPVSLLMIFMLLGLCIRCRRRN